MQSFSESMARFVKVSQDMEAVVEYARANDDWPKAYEMIFSTLKPMLPDTLPAVEWCDPDCDYDDDVMAFMGAVIERRNQYLRIMGAIGNPLKPHEADALEMARSVMRILNAQSMSNDDRLDAFKRHYKAPLINSRFGRFYEFYQYEDQSAAEQLDRVRWLLKDMVDQMMGFCDE